MKKLYIVKIIEEIRRRTSFLPIFILTIIAVAGPINHASAQRGNQSDWNVPPPAPPGNTTKGNATGREATSTPAVLTLTNIPAVSLPAAPAVQIPVLAAISTTPPIVNTPDQPGISGIGAGLQEIPQPSAPDAPPMPQRTLQDAPVPLIVDLPVPTAPDMPALPTEPTTSGQTKATEGPIPVMPDVISQPNPAIPIGGALGPWSIPGVPENVNFKLVIAKH